MCCFVTSHTLSSSEAWLFQNVSKVCFVDWHTFLQHQKMHGFGVYLFSHWYMIGNKTQNSCHASKIKPFYLTPTLLIFDHNNLNAKTKFSRIYQHNKAGVFQKCFLFPFRENRRKEEKQKSEYSAARNKTQNNYKVHVHGADCHRWFQKESWGLFTSDEVTQSFGRNGVVVIAL